MSLTMQSTRSVILYLCPKSLHFHTKCCTHTVSLHQMNMGAKVPFKSHFRTIQILCNQDFDLIGSHTVSVTGRFNLLDKVIIWHVLTIPHISITLYLKAHFPNWYQGFKNVWLKSNQKLLCDKPTLTVLDGWVAQLCLKYASFATLRDDSN